MTTVDFLRKLWNVKRRLHEMVAPGLEAAGLTPEALFVLAHLDPHAYPAELARTLCMPAPTLSHLLRRLEAQRYIVREADPLDLRRTRLTLTETGAQVLARGNACFEQVLACHLARLKPADIQSLDCLLDLLLRGDEADNDTKR